MPGHMEQYKDTFARCIDFPESKGKGKNGAQWDQVTKEYKKTWKQDVRALLTMTAWTKPTQEGSSEIEMLEGRRLITFNELMDQDRDISRYRISELVALIAIWLNWHDKGVASFCIHIRPPRTTLACPPCRAYTRLHPSILHLSGLTP